MGRKSNAKKIIREMLEEKQEKEQKKVIRKKKSKKQLKKEILKEDPKLKKNSGNKKKKNNGKAAKKKSKKSTTQVSKKLLSWLLSFIMLALLVTVGYLLFDKAFRAQPIAKMLPADHTVALLELNTNFNHTQVTKSFELLKNQPKYSKEKMIQTLESMLNADFEENIQTWFGRQSAVAVVNAQDEGDGIFTYYFIENVNDAQLNEFLSSQKAASNEYKNHQTHLIETEQWPYYLTTAGDYLVFSRDEQAINQFIDFQSNDFPKLYNNKKYRRIDDNLPITNVAFAYLDFENIDDRLFQRFAFLSEQGLSMDILAPFFTLFSSEGLAVVALEDSFAIQTFMSLNKEIANELAYFTPENKYTAELSRYLPQDTLMFWGGQNMETQLRRLAEVLSGGERSTYLVFDQILQNYASKYFGPGVDLEDDLFAVLDQEFAFAIEKGNSDEENIYKAVIQMQSPKQDALKLQELADLFSETGAIFNPRIIENTLADGTISREIVAIPEQISKEELEYDSNTVFHLKMGADNPGIYYSFTDDLAIISTNFDSLKNSIDLQNGTNQSLQNSELFTANIEPILGSSDEVTYFNFNELNSLLFDGPEMPDLFKMIDSFTSGRNYFNDGIVSINYLHLR